MKKKKSINYKELFFMGIAYIGTGVTFTAAVNAGVGVALMGLGTIHMLTGLKNKDKWKK